MLVILEFEQSLECVQRSFALPRPRSQRLPLTNWRPPVEAVDGQTTLVGTAMAVGHLGCRIVQRS